MDRPELESPASVRPPRSIRTHLVGDDDSGLAGLAGWLKGEGYEVSRGPTGSRVDQGHYPASVPRSTRWLVYAPSVPREHSDRLIARREGIEETSYPEVLRDVLSRRQGIAVAGRRQGRLTAAMIGWTLAHAGLDPTILLRGVVPQLGGFALAGRGPHAVVDVTGALHDALIGDSGPEMAVILDVEGLGDRQAGALQRLAASVGPAGYVLTLAGDPAVDPARFEAGTCVESLSLDCESSWWAADLRDREGRFRFRAFHQGRFAAEIQLCIPGEMGVLSALAALAVCVRLEVPIRAIKEALEDFEGMARIFESRGSYRGVTLIDDDSGEPADVAQAIGLARTIYGRRRIWTVFAPVGPPRKETVAALGMCDKLVLWDASVDSCDWAGMLEGTGVAARRVENLDEALAELDRHLEPGDVLLTLGAGEVETIADAFIRRLPLHRQGR